MISTMLIKRIHILSLLRLADLGCCCFRFCVAADLVSLNNQPQSQNTQKIADSEKGESRVNQHSSPTEKIPEANKGESREKAAKAWQGERTDLNIPEIIPESRKGESREKVAKEFHTNPQWPCRVIVRINRYPRFVPHVERE